MQRVFRAPERLIVLAVVLTVIAALKTTAHAVNIAFERVTDSTSTLPGTLIPVQAITGYAYDQGNVLFGAGNIDQVFWGICLVVDGVVSIVADSTTVIPGESEPFLAFLDAALHGSDVAFVGIDELGRSGVYATRGGLHVVADWQTPQPGGTEPFDTLSELAIDADRIAFWGTDSNFADGIYSVGSAGLAVVADWTTTMPGTADTFSSFQYGSGGYTSADAGALAFFGRSFGGTQCKGIYLFDGVMLQIIADNTMPVLGGIDAFDTFSNISLDAGDVAFHGIDKALPGRDGIYLFNGTITPIVHEFTGVPERESGIMDSLQELTLDAWNILCSGDFHVGFRSHTGVYLYWEGAVHKVIDTLDTLDGQAIWDIT